MKASILVCLPLPRLLLLLLTSAAGAQGATLLSAQQGSGGELHTIHVAGGVYTLQTPAAGGNLAVFVGPDGVLLVDDQFAPLTEAIVQAVQGISDEEIRFVINTHVHPDHIGGNDNLAGLGALIVAHDNVRMRMLRELRIPRRGGIAYPQPPEEALPVLTFGEAITFHMNGEEVRVFLVPPAHTDGDSFVYFSGSDVLHTGDVFRTNMYPIIDVYNGGSISGMIDALEIAIGLSGPNTKVIPGHGRGFTDRTGLIEVLVMMLDLREDISRMIAQGMTLDEVLAANPTAEYDEKWGQVPSWNESDLVPIIYNEFKVPNR